MNVKWQEVFKFLSGAAFAGAIANFYLAWHNVPVPVFGSTMSPRLLGIRAAVALLAAVVLFYLGYLKK
jgi:hypothetical protein